MCVRIHRLLYTIIYIFEKQNEHVVIAKENTQKKNKSITIMIESSFKNNKQINAETNGKYVYKTEKYRIFYY